MNHPEIIYDPNSKKNIEIRGFQLSDCDEALSFWSGLEGMGLSDADNTLSLRSFLERNPGLSFCALNDGILVATVLAGHDGRRGFIYHLAVDPRFRRLGIATVLLEKALHGLKKSGISKVHIFVLADNSVGKAFWSKWGASNGWKFRNDILVFSRNLELTL